mmetsp:Transcript_93005/g.240321  ORF Transcript_93005/g.240321 Transcript_93005/m.240321 type:complete len:312 (+) Transcript_93005:96-1031(+)
MPLSHVALCSEARSSPWTRHASQAIPGVGKAAAASLLVPSSCLRPSCTSLPSRRPGTSTPPRSQRRRPDARPAQVAHACLPHLANLLRDVDDRLHRSLRAAHAQLQEPVDAQGEGPQLPDLEQRLHKEGNIQEGPRQFCSLPCTPAVDFRGQEHAAIWQAEDNLGLMPRQLAGFRRQHANEGSDLSSPLRRFLEAECQERPAMMAKLPRTHLCFRRRVEGELQAQLTVVAVHSREGGNRELQDRWPDGDLRRVRVRIAMPNSHNASMRGQAPRQRSLGQRQDEVLCTRVATVDGSLRHCIGGGTAPHLYVP